MVAQAQFLTALESPTPWSHAWPLRAVERAAPAESFDARERLWKAALEADERSLPESSLQNLWLGVARGGLRAWWESIGPDRILLVARLAATPAMTQDEESIVARVLSGEQQKVLAAELSVAPSTVSGRFVRALGKLDLILRSVPVPLVLAAQTYAGIGPVPRTRSALFEHEGNRCVVISVPRPTTTKFEQLTLAEQAVAQWIIEGSSRLEVARQRKRSVHTVARQFHAIFSALGLTGRYALIRRALELGCFC